MMHEKKNDLGAQRATEDMSAGASALDQRPHDAIELGCPGHFIAARSCAWRRHTQIGTKYRVSSVGNYFYQNQRWPRGFL